MTSKAHQKQLKELHQTNRTHGDAKSSLYTRWAQMISRCYNKNNKAYKNYGGRGIKTCERWKKYENFRHDMGRPPSIKHTLDRIDVDKDYCKSNCRWTTRYVQSRNMRSNKYLTFKGERKIISDWAVEYGLSRAVLNRRLSLGWSVISALTTPVGKKYRFKKREMTLTEWADYTEIAWSTLYNRLQRGWSLEKTLTTEVTRWK